MNASPSRLKCQKCGESTTKTVSDSILTCSSCGSKYHAKKCLAYPDSLIDLARRYNWQCGSCKRCEVCLRKRNEKDLILCDACDRGFHCFCLVPQLWKPPQGSWRCPNCTVGSKENVAVARATRLTRKRHPSDVESPASMGSPDSMVNEEQPEPKRSRRREQSENTDVAVAAVTTPGRKMVSPVSRQKQRRRRSLAGTRPIRCSVSGCKGEGHISGRFPRHVYREFCPLYHNMSAEEAKTLREMRQELLQQHNAPKKSDAQQQHATEEERQKIECQLRKRRGTSNMSDGTWMTSPVSGREPRFGQFIGKFDLNLFRMAQGELAEDMERDPSLRNTLSSRTKWVRFGRYDIATWYPSQFPGEYGRLEKLFMCEYCLKFMRCEYQLRRHNVSGRCSRLHPPGEKIYEKGNLAVWEVDGKREKIYCQYLCLLAMLFLANKTLFKDVEAFYFYVLTVKDEKMENAYHLVAYFSKEKKSAANCNLSCILTLPPFLRRGYGHFLIDISYALSKLECKIGSPEHPLSDMGLKAYRSYWKSKIFDCLARLKKGDNISVKDLSQDTAIHQNDIISTLQYLGMVKYWRGQYWIIKTDAVLTYQKSIQKRKTDPMLAPREIDPACLVLKKDSQ